MKCKYCEKYYRFLVACVTNKLVQPLHRIFSEIYSIVFFSRWKPNFDERKSTNDQINICAVVHSETRLFDSIVIMGFNQIEWNDWKYSVRVLYTYLTIIRTEKCQAMYFNWINRAHYQWTCWWRVVEVNFMPYSKKTSVLTHFSCVEYRSRLFIVHILCMRTCVENENQTIGESNWFHCNWAIIPARIETVCTFVSEFCNGIIQIEFRIFIGRRAWVLASKRPEPSKCIQVKM